MRAFIQTFLSALLFTAACCNSAWAETVRPDIVVADFENETLDNWTAQGDAFTVGESRSLYRGGMGFVFGFHGRSLVNTLAAPKDDSSTGTLTSPKFTIERNYVTFLVGGGAFPGETGVALYVDGQKVAEQTGLFNIPRVGNEGLVQRFWDVKAYQGKTAQIVIFDKKAGGAWGHIKVDYICQSDVTPVTGANSVFVFKDAQLMKYDPMIFGHFIEHFHRQVYGGLYEPGSELSDENGFRKDVIAALQEIKTPIVRWPGGCFVSSYHWIDGVGPNRQPFYDKAWRVEDPNTFGTAEFVKWCRLVGCEPYICTNAGTGTPEEMSDWVEYCNLNIGKFGRMRQAHGDKEPFNVKYWSIGNENYGSWEVGAKTAEEWSLMVRESGKMMIFTDPDVQLFAAALPDENWTLPLLNKAGYLLKYVSIHGYWDGLAHHNNPSPYMDCMLRTKSPEDSIVRTIGVLEKARLRGRVHIAFDEWNLRGWHHPGHGRTYMDIPARDKNDINSTYTMADALFSACFLNSCLRRCDDVKIACFSPIVNTRGAVYVYPKGIVKRTTYHVFWMYTNLLEQNVLPIHLNSELLLWKDTSTDKVDAVLSSNNERTRFVLAAVNKDPSKDVQLQLDFVSLVGCVPTQVEATILSGSSPDDYNDVGAENRVVPVKQTLTVKDGAITLPPHSLSFITIQK